MGLGALRRNGSHEAIVFTGTVRLFSFHKRYLNTGSRIERTFLIKCLHAQTKLERIVALEMLAKFIMFETLKKYNRPNFFLISVRRD